MQKKEIWLPLLASIGAGAAAFYSMRNNNQGMSQIINRLISGFNSTDSSNSSRSGILGPFGMS